MIGAVLSQECRLETDSELFAVLSPILLNGLVCPRWQLRRYRAGKKIGPTPDEDLRFA